MINTTRIGDVHVSKSVKELIKTIEHGANISEQQRSSSNTFVSGPSDSISNTKNKISYFENLIENAKASQFRFSTRRARNSAHNAFVPACQINTSEIINEKDVVINEQKFKSKEPTMEAICLVQCIKKELSKKVENETKSETYVKHETVNTNINTNPSASISFEKFTNLNTIITKKQNKNGAKIMIEIKKLKAEAMYNVNEEDYIKGETIIETFMKSREKVFVLGLPNNTKTGKRINFTQAVFQKYDY